MPSPLRARWVLPAAFLLLFAALFLAEFQRDWGRGPTTLPVTLQVAASPALAADSVTVTSFDRKGAPLHLKAVRGQWAADNMFVSRLRFSLPRSLEQTVTMVRLTIGTRTFDVPRETLLASWVRSSPDSSRVAFDSPASLPVERSRLSPLRGLINWPGDWQVLSDKLFSSLWQSCLGTLLLGLSFLVLPWRRPTVAVAAPWLALPPGRVVAWCAGLAIIYGLVFLAVTPFDDNAAPRGDAWEYQSMAVNAAAGHGLNRLGTLEPFAAYRFYNDAMDSINYAVLSGQHGGHFHAYRTPGYPLFLAGVYEVCGVSPLRAKQAQLLLLVLVAAFLPWLGCAYWGPAGFYGGTVAGLLFLDSWHKIAGILYTEPLVAATAFLFAVVWLFYERRRSFPRVALVGLMTGAAMLIKGDLIFIAPLVLGYLLLQARKQKTAFAQALVFVLVCTAALVPWSLYASGNSGQFVVLSTQGGVVLPEGNNEAVWENGGWHPEYRQLPNAFYARPEIRQLPPARQILSFYLAYPGKIPVLLVRKLNLGFGSFPYLRIALILLLADILLAVFPRRPGGERTRSLRAATVKRGALGIAAVAALLVVPWTALFLVFCAALIYAAVRGILGRFSFPLSFAILFVNFLLITMAVFGERRFVSVIDSFFMLTAMSLLSSLVLRFLAAPKEPAGGDTGQGAGAYPVLRLPYA